MPSEACARAVEGSTSAAVCTCASICGRGSGQPDRQGPSVLPSTLGKIACVLCRVLDAGPNLFCRSLWRKVIKSELREGCGSRVC